MGENRGDPARGHTAIALPLPLDLSLNSISSILDQLSFLNFSPLISPIKPKMAALESIPKDLRNLRACLLCSMVKTFDQFEIDGCDNCEEFLGMKHSRETVYDCTSSNFDGLIAAMSPQDSWVCKWQRINRYAKGMYAISVSGRLPAPMIRELKTRGITYKSRDTSTR